MNISFCKHTVFLSHDFHKCIIQHFANTVYHPTSTCRIGPKSDKNSLVDTELRVKGIERLRVVDAYVMPGVVSGNTNVATI
ncbi:hypothetical protein DPMN_091820 [Dreissena polymorpha]|uniref:Glucose-methanol-choline oxidoreductase C-terminal domain-containing protein n=1 Tax=Dreissena polymorpha TaxID=45954 RepID=A0A9D4R126_DREPO|nr:hypothetical protein DPMN_091820 [Dreissena polymorpha]